MMVLRRWLESVRWWVGKLITLLRIHVFAWLSLGLGVYFFGFSQIARELWEDVLDPIRLGTLATTAVSALAWLWALAWTTQQVQRCFVEAVWKRHGIDWPACESQRRRDAFLGIVANLPPLAVLIAAVALLFGAITSEISERDKLVPLAVFATFAACTSGTVAHGTWLMRAVSNRPNRWRHWVALQMVTVVLLFGLLSMVVPDRIRTSGDVLLRLVPTVLPVLVGVAASAWLWTSGTPPSRRRFVVYALLRWIAGTGIVFAWWALPLLACLQAQQQVLASVQGAVALAGCRFDAGYEDMLVELAAMAIWVPAAALALEWLYLWIKAATGADPRPVARVVEVVLSWRARIGPGAAMVPVLAGAIVFALAPVPAGDAIGALGIALLALASWTLLSAVLFIVTPVRLGFGALPLAMPLWLLVVSPWTDNHRVDVAAVAPDSRLADAPRLRFGQRIDIEFEEWVRSPARSVSSATPIILVAASGGGVRAAYWTAVVLARLDDRTCGEFGRQVFAISAVSGGSIGAAIYAAARHHVYAGMAPHASCSPLDGADPGPVEQLVIRAFDQDLLAPLLGSMLFPDALQRFFPAAWLPWGDRARAIEQALEVGWMQASEGSDLLAQPLEALYEDDARREIPLLVFNSTNVGDGRRVVASPALLDDTLAYDLFAHQLLTRGMRLSTAALNSARFPAVSPPGSVHHVDGRAALRIVDGGYFENSAAATATSIYRTLQRRSVARHRPVALVLIENDPGLEEPSVTCGLEGEFLAGQYSSQELRQRLPRLAAPSPEASPAVSEVALELTAITGALLNARIARAPWHQRELAELVCAEGGNVMRGFFYRDGAPGNEAAVPDPALSWALSATTRSHMLVRSRGLVRHSLQGRFGKWR